MRRSGILIALGGNALSRPGGDNSWKEARSRLRGAVPSLVRAARIGEPLVLTHGNGPQVGLLLRQNELGSREAPPLPMDVLGAETQGQIGYLLQTELTPALRRARLARTILPIISRTEVARGDPAFRHPSKPIGRYYTDAEARTFRKRHEWTMQYDGARGGWRRLVASPRPIGWLEGETVRQLLAGPSGDRWIPVVTGGGGIPVVRTARGEYDGVDAVIDKDLAAALVARTLGLDTLAIVTDVPGAAIAYGAPGERWLGRISVDELRGHRARGEFGAGSMGPKVEATLDFLDHGGRAVVICDIPSLPRALDGEAGTRVSA